MGNLSTSGEAVKMLLIGDSGSGKTSALWSLAQAGYRVVIADFDRGLDFIRYKARQDPKPAENIWSESFQDKFSTTGGFIVDGIPDAIVRFGQWMNTCKGDGYDLGPVTGFDAETVFVIDSLTHLGNSTMRNVMAISGHLNKHASLPDWGAAQQRIENLLGELYSPRIKCNVIVIAHIDYITFTETGMVRGLPMAPGNKLSPKIPTYFNTLVLAKSRADKKKVLRTVSEGIVEAKLPALGVPEELPLETGLNTIFNTIRGVTK